MAWTYGAAWVISICKHGSDIMKMREGEKKQQQKNSVSVFERNSLCPET